MKIWKHKKRLIAFTLTVSIGLSAALPALGTSPVSAAQPDPLEVSVSPSAIQGDGGTAGQSIRQQEGIVQESLKLFGVAPAAYTAGTISGTSSEEGQTAATVFKVTQPYITLAGGFHRHGAARPYGIGPDLDLFQQRGGHGGQHREGHRPEDGAGEDYSHRPETAARHPVWFRLGFIPGSTFRYITIPANPATGSW